MSEAIPAIAARLRLVQIDHEPALSVIARQDAPQTLFYVDPPYLPSTRSAIGSRNGRRACYRHELDEAGHVELLQALTQVQGMVLLSGYPSELYDRLLPGWHREEVVALADSAIPRREVLWINPAAFARLNRQQTLVAIGETP